MTAAILNAPSATATLVATLGLCGRLLGYPGADFEQTLDLASATVDSHRFVAFRGAMAALTHDAREELYTATFDVTPQCVPYASIHLFGEENFKRGEFMAALHSRYELLEFATAGELPDHVAVLLRYASMLGEAERRELLEFCLLGPLAKMIRMLAENHPYRFLLEAVDELLHAHYPGLLPALSPLEQMRQHGICPTVSDACNCGPLPLAAARASARIVDGPADVDSPAEAGAPSILPRQIPPVPTLQHP
jgi:nitrate reductase delta subunit